jgi:hypothetical protein
MCTWTVDERKHCFPAFQRLRKRASSKTHSATRNRGKPMEIALTRLKAVAGKRVWARGAGVRSASTRLERDRLWGTRDFIGIVYLHTHTHTHTHTGARAQTCTPQSVYACTRSTSKGNARSVPERSAAAVYRWNAETRTRVNTNSIIINLQQNFLSSVDSNARRPTVCIIMAVCTRHVIMNINWIVTTKRQYART